MGRVPRAQAVQATATAVLTAADELFTNKPYEEVSLEQVAAMAGATSPAIVGRRPG